ncbi:hypothetical protein AcW1_004062 [Taiwanofungus camphoratus]|nr:hypothetical protein AcV7_007778 [Antrodia cinnamomea]KAI0959146.1 hypothetical protein AcW1_004062 [Antrodia cinnamomea]
MGAVPSSAQLDLLNRFGNCFRPSAALQRIHVHIVVRRGPPVNDPIAWPTNHGRYRPYQDFRMHHRLFTQPRQELQEGPMQLQLGMPRLPTAEPPQSFPLHLHQ